ncbi:hypothetical protein PENTCL1PPCAC_1062 [Pristionchus entomophagus]|uniref:Uncharacterized protein n=1 Tax=Pristionchus entomophagus TaxID=358040 RepID=A0AAV5S887_9BILA|nr:hypothetical protein PENTCL1PPCAC_1062 [Pristionchus entomophagus]
MKYSSFWAEFRNGPIPASPGAPTISKASIILDDPEFGCLRLFNVRAQQLPQSRCSKLIMSRSIPLVK